MRDLNSRSPWRMCAAVFSLLLVLVPTGARAASAPDFYAAPLGSGATIEIPARWKVATSAQRLAIGRRMEADGYHAGPSNLTFAAWFLDERGTAMASVTAWVSTDTSTTQVDAQNLGPADLEAMEERDLRMAAPAIRAAGIVVSSPSRMVKQSVNGLVVLESEATQLYPGDKHAMRTRSLRVFNGARTFTVILSYREIESQAMRPVIEHMAASIRQPAVSP
jgi:hypothetical protein